MASSTRLIPAPAPLPRLRIPVCTPISWQSSIGDSHIWNEHVLLHAITPSFHSTLLRILLRLSHRGHRRGLQCPPALLARLGGKCAALSRRGAAHPRCHASLWCAPCPTRELADYRPFLPDRN